MNFTEKKFRKCLSYQHLIHRHLHTQPSTHHLNVVLVTSLINDLAIVTITDLGSQRTKNDLYVNFTVVTRGG
jgi:hypothetical protein